MRVGIVTEWFERGSSYVSKQFLDSFEEAGWEVHIYARNENEHFGQVTWEHPRLTVGKKIKMPFAKPIHKNDFEAWVRDKSLDLILFNEQIWLPPIIWAKKLGVLTVGYIDYYTRESVPDFSVYDALICNTQRHYSVFSWHQGAIYVPWGTQTQVFTPKVRTSGREMTFFHSAGWSPYRKGTDLVISAFAAYVAETNSRSVLAVHTQVDLAHEMPGIEPDIMSLEAKGQLQIVIGTVSAPGLYHLGDVYVYPSRLEGIGLTMAEALACGLSLVVTDEPPMSEFAISPSSVVVPVEKRFTRNDGYYWDMVEVNKSSLKTAFADVELQQISFEDRAAESRSAAVNHFDWDKNSTNLVEKLKNVSRVTHDYSFENRILRSQNGTPLRYFLMRVLRVPISSAVAVKLWLKNFNRF